MDRRELGIQRNKDILGDKKVEELIAKFESISPDLTDYVLKHMYGDLYARKGFSDKFREMSAVACLIGQGNTGFPLKAHLQGMLNVGWTKDEIIELIIFLTAYVGFPSCLEAISILVELEIISHD